MNFLDAATPEGAPGTDAMVASGHPLAAWTALDVLSRGGSAADAAVAADAVLGVVEPMATGIGGDLLAMIVEPDGRPWSYNGTGRSPRGLTREAMAKASLDRIPQRSPWSVTVPGAVRGWQDLVHRFGRMPLKDLLAPAVELAEAGFPVSPVAAREWAAFDPVLRAHPEAARLYRASAPYRPGERFANPALGRVLRDIGDGGADAFYLGSAAHSASLEIQRLGGVLAADDFARHRGEFGEPLRGAFRGLEVLECPPNTHGSAAIDALALLDLAPLDPTDPQTIVRMAEAVEQSLERAQATVADPGNTVCTVVVDSAGLACVLMSSVFKRFGAGIAVPGHGFVLQNRAFGFAGFDHPNHPGPGRRPYHTVIPGAALKDGRLWAGFGVVGGMMQPQGHVQLLVRLAAWGQAPQPAVDAPRFRWESRRRVAVEAGMPAQAVQALRAAGFADAGGEGELGGRSDFGGAQVVQRVEGGWRGASDSRKDGMARGF